MGLYYVDLKPTSVTDVSPQTIHLTFQNPQVP